MSEAGAVAAYLQMLRGVGDRATAIGPRPIASHWPFVGSDYRRLLVVGRALAGWDDPTSPALWTPDLATTEDGRRAILDGSRSYAHSTIEPMSVPMRTRSGSSFWDLSSYTWSPSSNRKDAAKWFSRHAWWNLFPLGWVI